MKPWNFHAHSFFDFPRTRNLEKVPRTQGIWMRWVLLWAARTYVRISDNERRGSKAEETNGVKKREGDARDTQPFSVAAFVSTWWTTGNRLVFLNGSWWRISTCEPVALQLTGDNEMKGAGRRLERIHIRIGACLAQWLAFVDFSYAISLAGFFSECRS